MATERTLKLAILIGPESHRKWCAELIRLALGVAGVDLVLVIEAQPRDKAGQPRPAFREFLFHRALRKLGGAMADETIGTLEKATHVPYTMDPATDELAFTQPELEAIKGSAPDVLLVLGNISNIGALARIPAHGAWSFASADGALPLDIPPGSREAAIGDTVAVFRMIDQASNLVLREGGFPVDHGNMEPVINEILNTASRWPAQFLHELIRTGSMAPGVAITNLDAVPIPSNASMLSYGWHSLFGKSAPTSMDPAMGEWNIGVLHQPIHALLEEGSSENVRWFPSPSSGKGRVEPFGYYATDGELNVLYRKTNNLEGTSTISRLRPKPDNILKRSRIMLDLGSGHSYPYSVNYDGSVLVLRTAVQEDRTELYRLNDSNDGLDHAADLLHHALHAPTLFLHEGRWWLFGTRSPAEDTDLHIYYASTPFGPFTAHPLNPVKQDAMSARPAGTPFLHEGWLWRPASDASDPLAPAVVFNKVTHLDPYHFTEETGRRVDGFRATGYGHGLRTVCAMGDITLVDGLRSPVLTGKQANASRSTRHRSGKKRHK